MNQEVNQVDVKDINVQSVDTTGVTDQNFDKGVLNQEMLASVAQLNFNYPLGHEFTLAQKGIAEIPSSEPGWKYAKSNLPGILTLRFLPTFGIVKNTNDSVNTSANAMFTKLLTKLSTVVNTLDPPDVYLYFMAIDSLAIAFNTATKLYQRLRANSFANKYNTKQAIIAAGYDYNDFIQHGNELYWYISKWGVDLSQFVLPKTLTITSRHLALSSQVYKDSENERSQLIDFEPLCVFKNDAANGKLVPVFWKGAGDKMKFSELVAIMEDLIAASSADNGWTQIATLIRRVYTPNELYKFKVCGQNDVLKPVFDDTKLHELHNADFLHFTSATGLEISQYVDTNLNFQLRFDPTFETDDIGIGYKRIVDVLPGRVTSGSVLNAYALKFATSDITYSKAGGSTFINHASFKLKCCGSEVICNATISIIMKDGTLEDFELKQHPIMNLGEHASSHHLVAGYEAADAGKACKELFVTYALSNFDGAPMIFPVLGGQDKVYELPFFGRLDQYTIVEDDTLSRALSAMLYDKLGMSVNQ